MAKMTKLAKVQKAIEIQGYITVRTPSGEMKARAVKDVDGDWITDIPTTDLCGYVRIRKTKAAVVAQAESIIARETEIRAECAAREVAARARMMS